MSFLTALVSGLSLGSIYAIIALGYTMVYGIAKMLNLSRRLFSARCSALRQRESPTDRCGTQPLRLPF